MSSAKKIPTRRNAELALLILAVAVVALAYAQVGLATQGSLPPSIIAYPLGLLALAVAIHIVVRIKAPYADPVLLPVVTAINGLGLVMIYRLDIAYSTRGRDTDFAEKQLMWLILGIALATAVLLIVRDHRQLRRFTWTSMLFGLGLLLLPLAPVIGREINGSRIWVSLFGFSLQPAEFAKIILAIFFAGYLVNHRESMSLAGKRFLGLQLPRGRDLGPILVVWLVSIAVLVFQRDLGTSLLFFGLFVAMLYLATARTSWIIVGGLLFVAGAVFSSRFFGHVAARFDAWLDPFNAEVYDRAVGGSWQIVQGLFGLANGGMLGTGLGEGRPDIVPYAESDYIVASLGEEIGLTGLMALLLLYLIFTIRGLQSALKVRDAFGKLLAGGLAFVIALQCFIVVGGITRVIPLTGLTMPFLAYGGSSLLANWMILALFVRISNSAREPNAPLKRAMDSESDSQGVAA